MKKEIGHKIKEIRNQRKLSMKDFGDLFDPPASKGVVSNWENNYNYPNTKRLLRIAELGNITVDELLYDSLDDYARRLLSELEEDLQKDESIKSGVIPLIISDIESRLFPKFFPREFKSRESLENEFTEYKDDALELWTNTEDLDVEIVTRIGKQVSSNITDNLKYFHSDFYDDEENRITSDDKISERSDEFIQRLQNLDNFNSSYIDSLRFLDNDNMVHELDKLKSYTEKLNDLNGSF